MKRWATCLGVVLFLALAIFGCGGGKVDTPSAVGSATESAPVSDADASQRLEEARSYLKSDRVADAIVALETLTSGDQVSSEAYFLLGNALTQDGQLAQAEAAYRSAMELAPDDADVLSNLGVALYRMERLEEAVELFEQALELVPGDAEIQYNLGGALFAMHRVDEAVAAFESALEAQPDLAEVHLGLGYAYKELDERDKAIESFRQFIEVTESSEWRSRAEAELAALEQQ